MFFEEYALLVAVAGPVAVIGALNLMLALGGESGTLLLPSRTARPALEMPDLAAAMLEKAVPMSGKEAAAAEALKIAA